MDEPVSVTVKCEGCGDQKKVYEGEIAAFDFPMCDQCGMPMLPTKAHATSTAVRQK